MSAAWLASCWTPLAVLLSESFFVEHLVSTIGNLRRGKSCRQSGRTQSVLY